VRNALRRFKANTVKPAKIAAVAAITLLMTSALVSCRPPLLKSLLVNPTTVAIYHNYGRQLIVTAVYTSGQEKVVTNKCTYSSSDNVVSVTPAGLVIGDERGTATVTVSYTEGNVTQIALIPVTIVEFGGTENYSGIS
jgi:hypothetical protein